MSSSPTATKLIQTHPSQFRRIETLNLLPLPQNSIPLEDYTRRIDSPIHNYKYDMPGLSAHSSNTIGSPQTEEQMLTEVFFATTTHLFSIYTGPCNPFMRLRQYLPQSRALSLAVQAMAALTISGYDSGDKRKHMDRGLELQRLAYQEISQSMEDPIHVNSDAFFAAIVHIGMTEPWHTLRSGESGAMHLRTSKFLISRRIQQGHPLPPRYLCNLLLYWDLLVSLHSDSSHEGYVTDMLLSGVHSEEEPIDYIDPTLGLGIDLFPIIVEMENFLRFMRGQEAHGTTDDPHHIEVALAIERRLKAWRPDIDSNKLLGCMGVFETGSLQDILFTAEAYRQAALLLLYRTLPAISLYNDALAGGRTHEMVLHELASSTLRLLSVILITSPVCTTHEWILFITAPDVVSKGEREFIRDRMSGLLDKIGVVGIREVMDYIEEVWGIVDSGRAASISWMDGMYERNWMPLLG